MFFRKRWIVATGILVAGCCAALPFPRRAVDDSYSPRPPRVSSTSENDGPQLHLALGALPETANRSPLAGIQDHNRIQPLLLRTPVPTARKAAPPEQLPALEDSYPPPMQGPLPPSGIISGDARETGAGEVRYHQIQDGDTLRALAERYLGDADQDKAIYELNRSILVSPDLLPLGHTLHIPGSR
ncbi:MAG: hypothetical protein VYB09_06540 [Planctomycetota bacterium]|nr:hypothetical protein [Planctomycetota bacterium]